MTEEIAKSINVGLIINYPTHTYRIFLNTFGNKAELHWIVNFFPRVCFRSDPRPKSQVCSQQIMMPTQNYTIYP